MDGIEKGCSLPRRQLRKDRLNIPSWSDSSLPHRQLRNISPNILPSAICSLPHRQLKNIGNFGIWDRPVNKAFKRDSQRVAFSLCVDFISF